MSGINFGIIGSTCKDCSKTRNVEGRTYVKQAINEILNESLDLVCRQHESGEMCDCEVKQAKKVLEFLGNQCIFCNNKQALIYNEVMPYIKKENPLKEKEEKKVTAKISGKVTDKVVYLKDLKKAN